MKHFKSLATQEEEKEIQNWLSQDLDGSRTRMFQEAHQVFVGLTLFGDKLEEKGNKKFSFRSFLPWIKAVAVVLLLAVMVYAGRQSVYHELYAVNEKIYVPAGKSMTLTLEDGSVLHINSDTELEYPKVFSQKERMVRLRSGEVFFDVAKEEDRPFVVKTFASDITVLGTEFNVEVQPEQQKFSTVLLEGSVLVSSHLSDETMKMEPDDMVCMEKGRLVKTRLENADAVRSWTRGILDISNMPFRQVVEKLEDVYNVQIVVNNPNLDQVSYKRAKVWISEGIDQVLSIMQLAADFDYVKEGNVITIQ